MGRGAYNRINFFGLQVHGPIPRGEGAYKRHMHTLTVVLTECILESFLRNVKSTGSHGRLIKYRR